MIDPRTLSDMRDMVTNPAWKQLLSELVQMQQAENRTLRDRVRDGKVEPILHQGGLLDGIERVYSKLTDTEEKARNAPRTRLAG